MQAACVQPSIQVTAYGKCILAGEHSVLRGGKALVFPVPNRVISLKYMPHHVPLSVQLSGEHEPALLLIFEGVVNTACEKLGRSRHELCGQVTITNAIPLGGGMGFSAAFCAVIAKWLVAIGWLSQDDLLAFAVALEDYFHGKSSGVDVVGALSTQGALFSGSIHDITPVEPVWRPILGLTHSGRISVTARCIKRVQGLFAADVAYAEAIDQDMHRACVQAYTALSNRELGIDVLADAMQLAHRCFIRWGLVPEEVAARIEALYKAGAVAVKMTGAGDGGYLLSLWHQKPDDIEFDDRVLL